MQFKKSLEKGILVSNVGHFDLCFPHIALHGEVVGVVGGGVGGGVGDVEVGGEDGGLRRGGSCGGRGRGRRGDDEGGEVSEPRCEANPDLILHSQELLGEPHLCVGADFGTEAGPPLPNAGNGGAPHKRGGLVQDASDTLVGLSVPGGDQLASPRGEASLRCHGQGIQRRERT